MAYFDRFDICEAYLAVEQDWHSGGWLHERPSNRRRMESTDVQLNRMHFRPGAMFNGYESLSENGKDIYDMLCERYGFKACDACGYGQGASTHNPDAHAEAGVPMPEED